MPNNQPDLMKRELITAIKDKVRIALADFAGGEPDFEEQAHAVVRRVINHELSAMEALPYGVSYSNLTRYVNHELFGLGCLEALLSEKDVTDILVEDTEIIVVKAGFRDYACASFTDLAEVKRIIDRITARAGKRVDISNPFCDCRLHDGSRCHIALPPAADRIYISIRKLGCMDLTLDDWVSGGALPANAALMLRDAVGRRQNILISGGTGAGKTTLLNSLAKLIDSKQIVITIEDTPELILDKQFVRRLLTRRPNVAGAGAISFRDLLKNALRMNPDRLIMGEVRDACAIDLLQALNVGHSGSLSTIHANGVLDALWRLETLALTSSANLVLPAIRRQIARAINVAVQLRGLEVSGSDCVADRRIIEIAEVSSELDESGNYRVTTKIQGR